MKQLLILTLLFLSLTAPAKTIEESIFSDKMQRAIPCMVIVPENYNTEKEYPVIYLLHGYGGDQNSWRIIKPELGEIATRDSLIFVCPNGESSWYWDSSTNPQSQFETFVAKELIAYIDANYSTKADRNGRAITGFSMGGHGGLWLSIRHSDVFGAAGSISGGVDIRPFPEEWEMKKQLGSYAENPTRWDSYTVINQLDSLTNGELTLIIDCGYRDFFYNVNQHLHTELMSRGIDHDYYNRPGKHTIEYAGNALDYQILFFKKYFNASK